MAVRVENNLNIVIDSPFFPQLLGLMWGASYDAPNGFPACFFAETHSVHGIWKRQKVFFNKSSKPVRGLKAWEMKYDAICSIPGTIKSIKPIMISAR